MRPHSFTLYSLLMLLAITTFISQADAACRKWGCGGAQCGDPTPQEERSTMCTMMFSTHDECYNRFGECIRQPDGHCGWRSSRQLQDCLQNPQRYMPEAFPPVNSVHGADGSLPYPDMPPPPTDISPDAMAVPGSKGILLP